MPVQSLRHRMNVADILNRQQRGEIDISVSSPPNLKKQKLITDGPASNVANAPNSNVSSQTLELHGMTSERYGALPANAPQRVASSYGMLSIPSQPSIPGYLTQTYQLPIKSEAHNTSLYSGSKLPPTGSLHHSNMQNVSIPPQHMPSAFNRQLPFPVPSPSQEGSGNAYQARSAVFPNPRDPVDGHIAPTSHQASQVLASQGMSSTGQPPDHIRHGVSSNVWVSPSANPTIPGQQTQTGLHITGGVPEASLRSSVDSITSSPGSPESGASLMPTVPSVGLRRGKWYPEEESYTVAMIELFLDGLLPLQPGTTLRGFIAEQLHCDPMRVTKKLATLECGGVKLAKRVGKRTFTPYMGTGAEALRHRAMLGLVEFQQRFYWRIGLINQAPVLGATSSGLPSSSSAFSSLPIGQTVPSFFYTSPPALPATLLSSSQHGPMPSAPMASHLPSQVSPQFLQHSQQQPLSQPSYAFTPTYSLQEQQKPASQQFSSGVWMQPSQQLVNGYTPQSHTLPFAAHLPPPARASPSLTPPVLSVPTTPATSPARRDDGFSNIMKAHLHLSQAMQQSASNEATKNLQGDTGAKPFQPGLLPSLIISSPPTCSSSPFLTQHSSVTPTGGDRKRKSISEGALSSEKKATSDGDAEEENPQQNNVMRQRCRSVDTVGTTQSLQTVG